MSVVHFQISVTLSANQAELLSDIFSEFGALAVSMTDAQDEPLFQVKLEETPLWQATTVHALFDSDLSVEQIIHEIKERHPKFQKHDFYIEKIAQKNWVKETQKHFHAQQFGDLWICPQWEKERFQKNNKKDSVVFIEPGLAFGTGTHPTTQLCLTWLATHDLKNQVVIDYGCGSGILALAALACGAKTVYATDHDPQALLSTENNEKYNHFKKKLIILTTEEIKSARADIIIANILANPLIELAPQLTELLLPNGKLILSGVLTGDADRVINAYSADFTHTHTNTHADWVLMEFQKT